MTEIDKINLKNYIGKKVIVFHRNLKKVVNYITYDSQYHDYPYGFNYRRYTKDGKILIDNENGWDILKIFMMQINKDKMTDKITLELTLDELKTIDKYVELNEETKSVFDKIKYAYPQPKMTLQGEGDYAAVSYNDTTYYRLMGEDATCFCWYRREGVSANHPTPTLVFVTDAETERLLEGLYYNHIEVKKEKEMIRQNLKTSVRESVKWCEDHPNENPLDYLTPKTPEETEESLKEAFREAQQTEKWKRIQQKIDDGYFNDFIFIDRPNLLDFLKDKLGYSTDSCYEIVDAISEWLPETQSAEGSQNAYVESAVEGWNDAINAIRGKLQ